MSQDQKLVFHRGFKTALLKVLKPEADTGCFVDIGANFGQTMYEACKFDANASYYGFEPNPEAFVLLNKVAASLEFNATLFPWACAAEAGPIKLFSNWKLDTSATMVPEIRPDSYERVQGAWIAAYPFDMVSPQLGLKPGFILKIDVEGAENEVLRGALATISRYRPYILCEVLHAHRESEIALNDQRKQGIETLLSELGYTMYLCELSPDGKALRGLKRIDSIPRNTVYRQSPTTCDYVFAPAELPADLLRAVT